MNKFKYQTTHTIVCLRLFPSQVADRWRTMSSRGGGRDDGDERENVELNVERKVLWGLSGGRFPHTGGVCANTLTHPLEEQEE